jgi:hypothetical protein
MTAVSGKPWTRLLGQDSSDRTAGIGQLGRDCQDRTAREDSRDSTVHPEQEKEDKTARTGQQGQDS